MSMYVTGDTHGLRDIQPILDAQKEGMFQCGDYLVILGDVGVYWYGDDRDRPVLDFLKSLNCKVLWIDGNHENHAAIDNEEITEWHDGKVGSMDNIIHLRRGEYYRIDGKTFFVMGGGFSIDKDQRTPGMSWWEREMPSNEEYLNGTTNLSKHQDVVDYIFTHTCPRHVVTEIINKGYVQADLPGEKILRNYLERIYLDTVFKDWYFGHWHVDDSNFADKRLHALYNTIIKLY